MSENFSSENISAVLFICVFWMQYNIEESEQA